MSEILTSIPVSIVATGALVGIAASLLGTFVVLRGTSMLADAISHSIILGIVLVWMATGQTSGPGQIVGVALAGLLTVVATEALARTRRMSDDAAIGLVFPALFSIGVLLLNVYARDVHIDAHTVLLGEIGFVWLDVVTVAGVQVPDALLWMALIALVDLAFVAAFYKELEIATFDPGLAAARGFAPAAVAAFDAVGMVLFLAFVIVPPAAAWLLTDVRWRVLAYAAEETAVQALRTHLAWSDEKARAVVARCLDGGWVERHGDRLSLTERGRAAAREAMDPGRGWATAPSPAHSAPSAPRS